MDFKPVVFRINGQEYGVDISHVKAIERVQQIVNVPNSNADIKGIINLRGDVIPIYSLRHHFHLKEVPQTGDTRFIVVYTQGINIALEVESIQEIQEVTDSMIQPLPLIVKSDETEYIDKVINIKGRLILVLNLENLLSVEDAKNIKKMVDDMQK